TWSAAPIKVTILPNPAQVSAGTTPYTVNEGDSLTLTATAPGTPASYNWIINGIAVTGANAHGQTLVESWSDLAALGISSTGLDDTNPVVYTVAVTAVYGAGLGAVTSADTALSVKNVRPGTSSFTNQGPVNEGASGVVVKLDGITAAETDQT